MLEQVCVKCGTDVDEIKVYLRSGCRDEFWNDFIVHKPI